MFNRNISGGYLFDKFGTAKSMAYAGCMYILSKVSLLGYVGLAYAIGAPLFGIIKGAASFTVAWYFMIAFVAIGFIILVFAVIQIKRYQKKYIAEQAAKTTAK